MKSASHPTASPSRRLLSLLAFTTALPLVPSASAADITWDSGAGNTDWFDALNWSTDARPVQGFGTTGDGINFNSGTAVFNSASVNADTAFSGSTYVYKHLNIGQTSGQTGQVTFNGGNVTFDNGGNYYIGRSGGTGSLTVNTGVVRLGGAKIHIGIDSGSTGTVTVNGGSLIFGRETLGISAVIGTSSGSGAMIISGGSFTTRTALQIDSGGTFTVSGSGATTIGIGSESTLDGGWIQNSGGTLRGLVDVGGVSTILVDDTASTGGNNKNGDVTFASGSLLDVGFVSSSVAGTWVLMQWEGTLTNNGLQFASGVDTNIWSFNIDSVNKQLTITASAVPEPATFAVLAGLGVLGLAVYHRRRAV